MTEAANNYSRERVLEIVEHIIGLYKRIKNPVPGDNYIFTDIFNDGRLTAEGVLMMAEIIIDQEKKMKTEQGFHEQWEPAN